jgi:hypothetical protein
MGELCVCGARLVYKDGDKWCPRCRVWVDWLEVQHVV